jgi:hypothetical protein
MMASVHYIVVNECLSVWVPEYCEYTHLALLLVVDDRLNEAIPLSCVATRNGGGRDPGG